MSIKVNCFKFDFWERNPNTVDVLLSPEVFVKYESLFNSLNLKYQVIQNDIQEQAFLFN